MPGSLAARPSYPGRELTRTNVGVEGVPLHFQPLLHHEENMNLLRNVILTRPITGLRALDSLPPPVVESFWDLTDAAIKVVEQARDNRLLTRQEEHRSKDELGNLLEQALRLYERALDLAAIEKQKLEDDLNDRKTEKHLKEVLLDGYFNEIIRLMTRLVNYSQSILRDYDRHPVAVMDFNMLLNVVERLSGYVPDVPESEYAPSAPKIKKRALAQNPDDQDFLFILRSIAGEASTWLDRKNPFSEFNILTAASTSANKAQDRGRDPKETEYYLTRVWSGAYAIDVAELKDWQKKAWEDQGTHPKRKIPQEFSRFSSLENPSEGKEQSGLDLIKAIWQDSEEQEIWFYINGVVTDHWIAQLNAEYLADTFKRPINILHNPTEGIYRDLVECVKGRVQDERLDVVEDIRRELESLARDKGKTKIVVVAHSQGTIITAEIVKRLRNDKSPLLSRMEIFNFAFCADEIPEEGWRHLEHFVNGNDFVPSLCVVPENHYKVPGRIFDREDMWGHFLGAHYLEGFKAGEYKDRADQYDYQAVLFRYLNGENYGKVIPARLTAESEPVLVQESDLVAWRS